MQGVLIDAHGVAFAVNATAFTPSITQSDISSKACSPLARCPSAQQPLPHILSAGYATRGLGMGEVRR